MNNRGFGLIEALISVILLAICLAGGIALYHNADSLTSYTIHKKVANEMINSSMENLKSIDYSDPRLSCLPQLQTNPYITTINAGGLLATELPIVECVDDSGNIVPSGTEAFKRITLKITWSESQDPNFPFQIVTYIAP